jgi:hypothetical protein
VRSSKPLSPGEIRPSPILCLQVGHDGRSITEMGTRITQTPALIDTLTLAGDVGDSENKLENRIFDRELGPP